MSKGGVMRGEPRRRLMNGGLAGTARDFATLIGGNLLILAVLLIPVELGQRFFGLGFPPTKFLLEERRILREPWRAFLFDPDLLWVPLGYSDRVATARGQNPSIVFMGDSCTQLGRYDEELESMYEARNPGSDLTFVNVGVAGWSSWSGLQQLQRDVLPMRPKAMTIYYGWNDHWGKRTIGHEDKDAARFVEPSGLLTVQLANRMLLSFKRVFADLDQVRVSLTDFRANLRQMVRIARENDIVPILLTAPTSFRPGDAIPPETRQDVVPVHRRYVQAVREVAAAEAAPLIDLHQAFDRLPRKDLHRFFLDDGIHLRPEGNEKIAELIDQHLVEANLYPRIVADHAERAEAEESFERFKGALGDGRLLHQGPFDVWLDDGRLIYVKDRCVGSSEKFFLHVWPADPDDLPEDRKEHGFDNLDFEFSWMRLGFTRGCAASRPLPDYPVATVRTGQFVAVEGGFHRTWEAEIRLGTGR